MKPTSLLDTIAVSTNATSIVLRTSNNIDCLATETILYILLYVSILIPYCGFCVARYLEMCLSEL